MKRHIISVLTGVSMAILLSLNTLKAQEASTILGKWKGVDEPNRQTEFFQGKDGHYFGRVINDKEKPANNGKILFKDLSFDKASNTFTGKLVHPEKDMELDVVVSFESNSKLKAEAHKYFISKTIYFIRIQ